MIVKTDGSDGSFEALFLCLCPVSQLLLPWLRPAAARRRNEKYRILSPRHKLRVNLHNLPADSKQSPAVHNGKPRTSCKDVGLAFNI